MIDTRPVDVETETIRDLAGAVRLFLTAGREHRELHGAGPGGHCVLCAAIERGVAALARLEGNRRAGLLP